MDIEFTDSKGNKLSSVSFANLQDIIDYKNNYNVTEAKTKTNTVPLFTFDQVDEIAKSLCQQLAKLVVADAMRDAAYQLLQNLSFDDEEGLFEHAEQVINLRAAIAAYDAK